MPDSHPYINGWGVASQGSWTRHGILWPTDIGQPGPALCGTLEARAQGWQEAPVESDLYCSECMVVLRKLYETDDPRLTIDDRKVWRSFLAKAT